MTSASVGVDNHGPVPGKITTTVALDFGRISLDESLRLYLFGTPGQDRYAFLWDDLVEGALGAVVLLDTSRIEDCFPAIDYFEEHHVPFLVAVNLFQETHRFELSEVREALGVIDSVPVLQCDARMRESVKGILVALTEEVLARRLAEQGQAVTR
jgi:signal recognition particle receptor subunit beta